MAVWKGCSTNTASSPLFFVFSLFGFFFSCFLDSFFVSFSVASSWQALVLRRRREVAGRIGRSPLLRLVFLLRPLLSLFLSFFRICVCLSLSVMSVFPSLLYFLPLSPCAFPGSFLPVFFSLFARLCFSWVFLFVLVSRSWCLCFSFPSSCSSSPPPPFLFGPFSGY